VPSITITINLDVPEGTSVNVTTNQPEVEAFNAGGIPAAVQAKINSLVPSRYRPYFEDYVQRVITEYGCTVEIPDNDRKDDYLNVYPPARCRRSRVSGITYSSSRAAIYTGAIDLAGFELAVETFNNDKYAYPKLPHLDSQEAVDEALRLSAIAIERLER
jgi:hypothetical protein